MTLVSITDARRQGIADILRRTAARDPNKPAVACGKVRWTYAELDERCNRLANGLLRAGVVRGDRIALLARNSHTYVAMRFAIARMGGVLVPVNFMLTAEEVAYILQHSGARLLFVDTTTQTVGLKAAMLAGNMERVVWMEAEAEAEDRSAHELMTVEDLATDSSADAPTLPVATDDLAQIVYTSGTESRPKGVMLTHEAIIAQYATCLVDAEIRSDDVILHSMPLYHCAQLDVFLGPGVYVGTSNIIVGAAAPEKVLPLMERFKISSYFAPPTVWISLLRSPLFDSTDLSSLVKGYYGASIMPVEILREIQTRLPRLRLWNLYGQTELAPVATVLKPEDQLRKPGSAGRAGLNVETRVVNEKQVPVAPGEVGEVVHRSPQLLLGYYNDIERTQEAFVNGWFHSGDLATMDQEGYITIVDRKKDMIKSGGENISSREVEEVLYGLPAVSEAAVVGVPDPVWVEAVLAVIVVRAGSALTETEVITFCRERLARFKVPKRVVFADALPRNPSGKVLKRDLRNKVNP
jgi:fatty-acyl-CoA synthase